MTGPARGLRRPPGRLLERSGRARPRATRSRIARARGRAAAELAAASRSLPDAPLCARRPAARHADRPRRQRPQAAAARDRALDRLDRRAPRAALGARPRCAPARSCSPRAGLLDGRRATTHWASARRARSASTRRSIVDPEPIFVRDGRVWTSAGVTAGHGPRAGARRGGPRPRAARCTIARHLVLFLRRPGNQSQFSATLAAQQPEREPLREIQRLVLEDVAGRPLGRGDGRARPHEPAPLRPRVPRRDRAHAGPLRRARAPGGGAPAARGRARAGRGGRRGLRLRHRRDDAPRRSCAPWRSAPPSTAAASTTAHDGEHRGRTRRPQPHHDNSKEHPWTSRSSSTTASPRSTRSGPTRCSAACRARA